MGRCVQILGSVLGCKKEQQQPRDNFVESYEAILINRFTSQNLRGVSNLIHQTWEILANKLCKITNFDQLDLVKISQ